MSRYSGEQSLIIDQILRICPSGVLNSYNKLFGFAGMLRKNYGYDITLKILTNLREGSSIPYIIGALKKESEDIKLMEIES